MSTSLLDRPTVIQAPAQGAIVAAQEAVVHQEAPPLNWVSRMMLKSYLSSLNICLSDLGWVPRSILEVGSGDGTMLAHVGRMFNNVSLHGVEFDADTVARATENNCCKLHFQALGQAESLPFDDNQFDLVISHGLLTQTSLPRHWVREMARVSAEGVIVSVQTPAAYRWMNRVPGSRQTKLASKPVFASHVQPVRMLEVRNWLTRSDLNVETTIQSLPYGFFMARKPQTNKTAMRQACNASEPTHCGSC